MSGHVPSTSVSNRSSSRRALLSSWAEGSYFLTDPRGNQRHDVLMRRRSRLREEPLSRKIHEPQELLHVTPRKYKMLSVGTQTRFNVTLVDGAFSRLNWVEKSKKSCLLTSILLSPFILRKFSLSQVLC